MSLPSKQNDKAVQRVIVIEGCANALVLAAKTIVGISTGSLAILGDALHSLTDVGNNIVVWGVVKHSSKPADREHPYGHRKFETIAVLGLAVILTLLAFELALYAWRREGGQVISSGWELAVMFSVLVINIALASWQRYKAKQLDSNILQADASHTLADVLTTLVVIVGWQLSTRGYLWLDQLCAFAVAVLILYLAFGLFKKVTPVLVDGYAVDPQLLSYAVMKVEGVKGVKRVRSRWIGSFARVDLIILVQQELTTRESHQICDNVESMLEKEFYVSDISIHVEPFHDQS